MPKLHRGTYTCFYRSRWSNKKYRNLSDDAKSVFDHILTTEYGSQFGLFKAGIAAMAEERDWEIDRYRAAVEEVIAIGWVEYDPINRVWWVPEYPSRNPPNSNTVVISWGRTWTEMPDCDLKKKSWEVLRAAIVATSEKYEKLFHTSFIPVANEPNSEPKREPKSPNETSHLEASREANGEPSGEPPLNSNSVFSVQDSVFKVQEEGVDAELPLNAPPVKISTKGKVKKTQPRREAKGTPVWNAYSKAYAEKYEAAPVRNAKTNALCCQLVDRLGADDAPLVAAWYVRSDDYYYAKRGHGLGILIGDAEKVHTEWATGKQIEPKQFEAPAEREWREQKERAAQRTREADKEKRKNGNEIVRVEGRAAFHGGISKDENDGQPPPALDGPSRRD